MGNKHPSAHLTDKTFSNDTDDHHRDNQQHDISNSDGSFETSSFQSNTSRKYGPSPRSRRRHSRQVQLEKKTKKSQVLNFPLLRWECLSWRCCSSSLSLRISTSVCNQLVIERLVYFLAALISFNRPPPARRSVRLTSFVRSSHWKMPINRTFPQGLIPVSIGINLDGSIKHHPWEIPTVDQARIFPCGDTRPSFCRSSQSKAKLLKPISKWEFLRPCSSSSNGLCVSRW